VTTIAVIGDRTPGFEAQDAIEPAVAHSAAALGIDPPTVRWFPTDDLDREGPDRLRGASGVWCAPGSPYRSLDGALAGIRFAREHDIPFLGTCAGFQHGVIEVARHVLGHTTAAHAEYGGDDRDDGDGELFIDELLCSLVGQTMRVHVVDDELAELYGTAHPTERYYCRFGLQPRWRQPLRDAGLRVAGVDASDGDVRILRLAGARFHVLTLFVPQTSSTTEGPHPLITSFVGAATRPAAPERGWRIRPATPDDALAEQAIERAAGARFRTVGMADIADHEPDSVDALARYATSGRSWVAVDDDGDPLGYVLVDDLDGNAHVEQISVGPEHQGLGVARALLDEVDRWAAAEGRPALTLTTFTAVAWNRPLYEHLGFRVLADGELGPGLRARRDEEAGHGLDPATRVCMRRDVSR
jgi:GNAT superfamily N-acetyltransferase